MKFNYNNQGEKGKEFDEEFDMDLIYPLEKQDYFEKEANLSLEYDENVFYFNGAPFREVEQFFTIPKFKKSCLSGKYFSNLGNLKLKIESKRYSKNGLQIKILLKNISNCNLENFIFDKPLNPGV